MAHDKIHPSTTRFVWERLASYRLLGEDHYHLIDDSNYEQLLILDTPFHLHRTGDTTVPFDQVNYFSNILVHHKDVLPDIRAGKLKLVFMFTDAWSTVNRWETHKEYSGNMLALDLYNILYRVCSDADILEHSCFCTPSSLLEVEQHTNWPIIYYNEPFNRYFEFEDGVRVQNRSFEKHFFWLNRRTRQHRLYALHQANKFDIFKDSVYTFYDYDEGKLDEGYYPYELKFFIDEKDIDLSFLQHRTPEGILDPDYSTVHDYQHVKELHGLKHHADRCYVELVSEFTGSDKKVFLTEKIARSIVMGKPFIVFGDKAMLSELHRLGFRTFNKFWDESYDLLPTMKQRIDAALEVAVHLRNTVDLSQGYSPEMMEILEYNRNHYYTIYKTKQFENFTRAVQ